MQYLRQSENKIPAIREEIGRMIASAFKLELVDSKLPAGYRVNEMQFFDEVVPATALAVDSLQAMLTQDGTDRVALVGNLHYDGGSARIVGTSSGSVTKVVVVFHLTSHKNHFVRLLFESGAMSHVEAVCVNQYCSYVFGTTLDGKRTILLNQSEKLIKKNDTIPLDVIPTKTPDAVHQLTSYVKRQRFKIVHDGDLNTVTNIKLADDMASAVYALQNDLTKRDWSLRCATNINEIKLCYESLVTLGNAHCPIAALLTVSKLLTLTE